MDANTEEQAEQPKPDEQPELVPTHELTDRPAISPSVDNGLPYPDSRGVFRMKIE